MPNLASQMRRAILQDGGRPAGSSCLVHGTDWREEQRRSVESTHPCSDLLHFLWTLAKNRLHCDDGSRGCDDGSSGRRWVTAERDPV